MERYSAPFRVSDSTSSAPFPTGLEAEDGSVIRPAVQTPNRRTTYLVAPRYAVLPW
jgi:hypothetical protein